jgi:hypothetical protein
MKRYCWSLDEGDPVYLQREAYAHLLISTAGLASDSS